VPDSVSQLYGLKSVKFGAEYLIPFPFDPRVLLWVAPAVAWAAVWAYWCVGKESTLTPYRIMFSCVHRWHNIEKARIVLGYEPLVGMEEGINRTIEWWRQQQSTKH